LVSVILSPIVHFPFTHTKDIQENSVLNSEQVYYLNSLGSSHHHITQVSVGHTVGLSIQTKQNG
jgi:hypothetical protein